MKKYEKKTSFWEAFAWEIFFIFFCESLSYLYLIFKKTVLNFFFPKNSLIRESLSKNFAYFWPFVEILSSNWIWRNKRCFTWFEGRSSSSFGINLKVSKKSQVIYPAMNTIQIMIWQIENKTMIKLAI